MRIHNQRALDAVSKQRTVAADMIAELNRREALIRSFERGVPLQLRRKGTAHWEDTGIPSWQWDWFEYRIKPEPEEFFITVYGNPRDAVREGEMGDDDSVGSVYSSAVDARKGGMKDARIFKVVEVIG